MATADDISFVLSGGSANLDPNESLGGDPSATPLVDASLNNLFDDITADQSTDGHEDFRCLYIFNDSENDIFGLTLWILEDFEGGPTVELGVESKDEVQRVVISGAVPTTGSLVLSYEGNQFTVAASASLATWVDNFQAAMDAIEVDGVQLLEGATVTGQLAGSTTVVFQVTFGDINGKRNHSKIAYISDTLSPSATSVSVTVPQEGSPINTIAPQINLDTTPPGGVDFYVPTESDPISIPVLRSSEGFPFWVKRTTAAGTTAVASDGFQLRLSAETLRSE